MNYQFTYNFSYSSAVPIGPIKVTINENEEPEIDSNGYFHEYFENTIYGIYDYIDSTFKYIESVKNGTYNDGGNKIKKIELKITFNNQNHYPVKAILNTHYSEPVGGGVSYKLEIYDFALINNN